MKLADPWAKLAAAYHLVENRQALDALLERHGAAAAGIGDLYAAAHDWQRAIALYRKAITHQPADADLPAKLAAVYQSAGRTRESIPLLAMASAANPQDTILSLKVGDFPGLVRPGQGIRQHLRRGLEFANGTSDPTTADRTAKMCFLRPAQNQNRLESALALARKAVQLGKNDSLLPYFQMAHGMALYRTGHFAEADAALIASANGAKNNPHVAGTSAFYRAMSLFQQGKKDDARKLATEAAARMKPLPGDEQNPLAGDAVPDDLILWLAYKEADALIKFDAAPLTKAAGDKE